MRVPVHGIRGPVEPVWVGKKVTGPGYSGRGAQEDLRALHGPRET